MTLAPQHLIMLKSLKKLRRKTKTIQLLIDSLSQRNSQNRFLIITTVFTAMMIDSMAIIITLKLTIDNRQLFIDDF